MKSPLQKISAEQARMKRQWGYFKSDNKKILSDLTIRLSELEDLLTVGRDGFQPAAPRAEPAPIHAASGAAQCLACERLLRIVTDSGERAAIHEEFHQ